MTQAKDRLSALRAELGRRGLDGFLVPMADEHQGEFIAPHARRLAWLTGFTGSAGIAVVLRDRAALFTDGRYTLQAREEVDGELYELLHITNAPPDEWLKHNLGTGALGYDPWLHTLDGVARYRAACESTGGKLVADRRQSDRRDLARPAAAADGAGGAAHAALCRALGAGQAGDGGRDAGARWGRRGVPICAGFDRVAAEHPWRRRDLYPGGAVLRGRPCRRRG